MSRKVYVIAKTSLVIKANEGTDIDELFDEMDYGYKSCTEGIDVLDEEIRDVYFIQKEEENLRYSVSVRIILDMEEEFSIDDFFSECDYNFSSNTDGIEIIDMDLRDYEIQDSK